VTAQAAVVLGVDLGTSAIKAVAVGEDGAVLAAARREYPTARPEPGAAEQDPQQWFTALESALDELAHAVPTTSWAGMGPQRNAADAGRVRR
jgi:xylulokinase